MRVVQSAFSRYFVSKSKMSTHRACTTSKDLIAGMDSRAGSASTFTIDRRSTMVLGGSCNNIEGEWEENLPREHFADGDNDDVGDDNNDKGTKVVNLPTSLFRL